MAKVIMIQGTMSNAGKSLITAGLCRIFKQDGYKTAPFKSQNMALNSFITEEGLEMGRAQVMQAEAAGVKPTVSMNPILLKPTNDIGSQVIVNGKSIGNMSARDYFAYKKKLIPQIMKAYETLEKEYDVIVIEGAGSPAEINLKENDIVNMGLAKLVDAPVLLVGDIDRGGVFAQLFGTVELLEAEERRRIKGLIINKFRGDKSILDPGILMLEEKCRIPVVAVTPYMKLDIEDEDSLSERLLQDKKVDLIDIAIIRLSKISNFTDFNRLESIGGVSVRYVSQVSQLKNPDLILVPGTKNTMGDLKILRQNGLEAAIKKASETGCIIFGICGGYQMLGRTIKDLENCEEGGMMEGMGLLPVETAFHSNKTTTQVTGKLAVIEGSLCKLSGFPIEGYEIHMGESKILEHGKPLTKIFDMETKEEIMDGCQYQNVYGTYVHGIFDQEEVIKELIHILAERKGIVFEEHDMIDYNTYKQIEYDKLADGLRANMDLKKIYEILEGAD